MREHKIGEIFEHNGEWYQCLKGIGCNECDLQKLMCYHEFGECSHARRKDGKSVIFKKLEKVGEPYGFQKRTFQTYRLHTIPFLSEDVELVVIPSKDNNTIEIEIKQNKKEDMEIDKVVMNIDDRDYLLDRLEAILHDTHCQQYKDEICEAFSKYIVTETASGLKPFDLKAAKSGKPVYTRDGRKARIICFNRKDNENNYNIVALVENKDSLNEESIRSYYDNGKYLSGDEESVHDLMMLPEKKEGWVNIYRGQVYNAFEKAEEARKIAEHGGDNCLKTIKIEWEE